MAKFLEQQEEDESGDFVSKRRFKTKKSRANPSPVVHNRKGSDLNLELHGDLLLEDDESSVHFRKSKPNHYKSKSVLSSNMGVTSNK